jgi:hypothetical protein
MIATVKVEATDSDMRISVLNVNPVQMWRAEFKSGYLEDICRKTGNPKSFIGFNQLLKQAL